MSLILHYRLDGNAKDSIGVNDGTPNNVSWVDGKLGQAVDFNASDSSISLPDTIGNFSAGISIAFWTYIRQVTSNYIINFQNSNGDRVLNIHLVYSNGNTYWDCGNDGGNYDRISKSNPNVLNEWHHWVF